MLAQPAGDFLFEPIENGGMVPKIRETIASSLQAQLFASGQVTTFRELIPLSAKGVVPFFGYALRSLSLAQGISPYESIGHKFMSGMKKVKGDAWRVVG